MLAALAGFAQLLIPLAGMLLERMVAVSRRKEEMRNEAVTEIRGGVATRDRGRVTAGFDQLGRV